MISSFANTFLWILFSCISIFYVTLLIEIVVTAVTAWKKNK